MFQLRDKRIADEIVRKLKEMNVQLKIMHVCGTHQDTIVKHGLDSLLKECGVQVIQGPGCPVCVTTSLEIEKGIRVAKFSINTAGFNLSVISFTLDGI